jgi:hypothetical protein
LSGEGEEKLKVYSIFGSGSWIIFTIHSPLQFHDDGLQPSNQVLVAFPGRIPIVVFILVTFQELLGIARLEVLIGEALANALEIKKFVSIFFFKRI